MASKRRRDTPGPGPEPEPTEATVKPDDAPGLSPRNEALLTFMVSATRLALEQAKRDHTDELLALRELGLVSFMETFITVEQRRLYMQQLWQELQRCGVPRKRIATDLRLLAVSDDP